MYSQSLMCCTSHFLLFGLRNDQCCTPEFARLGNQGRGGHAAVHCVADCSGTVSVRVAVGAGAAARGRRERWHRRCASAPMGRAVAALAARRVFHQSDGRRQCRIAVRRALRTVPSRDRAGRQDGRQRRPSPFADRPGVAARLPEATAVHRAIRALRQGPDGGAGRLATRAAHAATGAGRSGAHSVFRVQQAVEHQCHQTEHWPVACHCSRAAANRDPEPARSRPCEPADAAADARQWVSTCRTSRPRRPTPATFA